MTCGKRPTFYPPCVSPCVAKTSPKLAFETRFRVKGKVVESVMCDCEEEGHIGIRVARQADRSWDYKKEARDSYFDIVAYSSDNSFLRVRPGDWVEADVTIRGEVSHVVTGELDRRGVSDGHRYEGRVVRASPGIEVDFGTFVAKIPLDDEEVRRRLVENEGLRPRTYVESECAVEAMVLRFGLRDEILGRSRRVFPRRSHP